MCFDFLKFSFTLEGEGGCWLMFFFFLLHLTCGRRKGRGLLFFNPFAIIEWLGKRRGLIFFYKFIMGGGAGS